MCDLLRIRDGDLHLEREGFHSSINEFCDYQYAAVPVLSSKQNTVIGLMRVRSAPAVPVSGMWTSGSSHFVLNEAIVGSNPIIPSNLCGRGLVADAASLSMRKSRVQISSATPKFNKGL